MATIVQNLRQLGAQGYRQLQPALTSLQIRTAQVWAKIAEGFAYVTPIITRLAHRVLVFLSSIKTALTARIERVYRHFFPQPVNAPQPVPAEPEVPINPDTILINAFLINAFLTNPSGEEIDALFDSLSNETKDDATQMLKVVPLKSNLALPRVSVRLRNDETFMVNLLQSIPPKFFPGLILYDAGDDLKKSKSFVSLAVSLTGCALCYADPAMQDNEDVVLIAVTQDGEALQHANARFFKDLTIANAAFRQNPEALQWIDESLYQILEDMQQEDF